MRRKKKRNPVDRLLEKLDMGEGEISCWNWQAGLYKTGYGCFRMGGVGSLKTGAHRAAYILLVGDIPYGMLVLHKCDNKRCCNPKHLFLGTHADNSFDMVNKGRAATGDKNGSRKYPERLKRGENHPQARLTVDQVRKIREDYIAGTFTLTHLAKIHQTDYTNISLIGRKKTWRHI